jgi:hypothetical protein
MLLPDLARHYRFDAVPAEQRLDHLPPAVAAGLPLEDCLVFPVSDEHSDTAAFSERYGFGLEDCANYDRAALHQGHRQFVVVGARYRRSKILLAPSLLSDLPLVDVAPLTLAPS